MEKNKTFGGLSKIEMDIPEFDLGSGIIFRKTYAHLFAPFLMAFSPPRERGGIHGGPWKTTKGGVAFDILVEIEVSEIKEFSDSFTSEEIIWLLACMIRLGSHPFVMVSALSDMSFCEVKTLDSQPTLILLETKNRIFSHSKDVNPKLTEHDLEWLKHYWKDTLKLLKQNPKFYAALKAFDEATVSGKLSLSLLQIWGAIEQLFSPNTGELKYRVCSNLAAYLAEHGEKRLEIFKDLTKLYSERSIAAHTSKDLDFMPVLHSFVYFRNAVIKIIESGKIPTQDDLENLIFKK